MQQGKLVLAGSTLARNGSIAFISGLHRWGGQLVWLVHHHGKCVCGGNFMHVVRRFFTNYQLWCSGFSCSRVEVAPWRAVRKNFPDNRYGWCLIMVGVPMAMVGCTAPQGIPSKYVISSLFPCLDNECCYISHNW